MRLVLLFLALCACGRQASTSAHVVTTERNATLAPTEGAIGGVIVDADDDKPLSMVSVQAEQDGKRMAHDISDHEGRYRLGPLRPGHYDLRAKFAGARAVHKSIAVARAQETSVRIRLNLRNDGALSEDAQSRGARGSIEGVVLDGPYGNPFPGTAVSLSASHLEDVVITITDDAGTFRFRSLRPGLYNLSSYYTLVEQGNVDIRRSNIVVKPGETTSVQLVLDLSLH